MEQALTTVLTPESRAIILNKRCETLSALCNINVFKQTYSVVRTVNDCLEAQDNGEPVLLSMARQNDRTRKQTEAVILVALTDLNKFLHLKNPLTNEEGSFIAEQVVDELGGALTFADVFLVIKNAKAGLYGKFYERVSAPDVIGWFRQYYDDRLVASSEYEIAKKKEISKNFFNTFKQTAEDDPVLGETILAIVNKGRAKKAKAKAKQFDRVRTEMVIRNILAKPEQERSDREIVYLAQYQRKHSRKKRLRKILL